MTAEEMTMEMTMEIDKLTESYTLRIPEVTKAKTDRLSSSWKKKLNEAILLTIARTLHDADFKPSLYLKGE